MDRRLFERTQRDAVTGMTLLYAVTMCLSGAMLFLLQPMFARMVLPLFGGAPAVWNTAMLFYQVTLLLGYLYAHGLRRWVPARWQVAVHLVVVLLPLAVLPLQVPTAMVPVGGADPVPGLLAVLAIGVGLPFFVVSTTSPLLQSWFGDETAGGRDPYALYAASNAGSMLALLAYPFVVEPSVRLDAQSRGWSGGYVVFGVLVLACGLVFMRRAAPAAALPRVDRSASAPVSPARRLRWVVLAFVPSSLMLSVTTYMATNIAPVPLLWIVPLALYLLTFIVAFASRRLLSTEAVRRAFPLVLLPLLALTLSEASSPIRLLIGLHLLAFSLLALACHGELAVDAPPASGITEFYLWVSIGGALGGVFNALVAPRVFDSVVEYPLALVVAALVMRPPDRGRSESGTSPTAMTRALDLSLPLCLAAVVVLTHAAVRAWSDGNGAIARSAALGVAVLLCFPMAARPLRFGVGVAAVLVASLVMGGDRRLLHAERSFFGISRVVLAGGGRFHELAHGNITHGSQDVRSVRTRREPLTYYTRTSPVGVLLDRVAAPAAGRRVGVVGLGAGALACHARPGDRWTFFEIDPVVARIARDPRLFTYVQDCAPTATITMGDARLSLQQSAASAYDLLLLDAYSADAIPLHLITREALALYRRTVARDGFIAFHVSNRYFDLEPVVMALAADAGLRVLVFRDVDVGPAETAMGKTPSIWMLVAQPLADVTPLLRGGGWRVPAPRPLGRVWTDDFSSTISALR
jgi:spermidine synthase